MIKIVIPERELYDEKEKRFFLSKSYELVLEHSLISISKWESKWEKPFLTSNKKSREERIDYVRCMVVSPNVPEEAFGFLTNKEMDEINRYIDAPMTATTFNEPKSGTKKNNEITTSEIFYYWMSTFQIPWEAQKWHLNRLITLIRVFSIKNQKQNKKPRRQVLEEQRALNQQRREQFKTKG